MTDEKKLAMAKAAFQTLCQALDARDWKYKKDEEKLTVECGARGDDLPIDLDIRVDAKRMLVMVLSHMPFVIKDDKRLDVAVAVAAVNNALVDGCFDFDLKDGHMFFRMTNSFADSQLGLDLFTYLVYCSCQTIDEYNDKFLMLGKDMLPLEKFIETI